MGFSQQTGGASRSRQAIRRLVSCPAPLSLASDTFRVLVRMLAPWRKPRHAWEAPKRGYRLLFSEGRDFPASITLRRKYCP
jgi:hypothetical protein